MHREARHVRVKSHPLWLRGTSLVLVPLHLLSTVPAFSVFAAEAVPVTDNPVAPAPSVSTPATPPAVAAAPVVSHVSAAPVVSTSPAAPRASLWNMKRGQPPSKANLPTVKLKFSSKCSDDEFYRVRGLSLLSLVPMGGRTTPAENADLAQVLIDHQQIRNSQAKIDMITGFLQTHPHSAWRASLLANLGMMYRR